MVEIDVELESACTEIVLNVAELEVSLAHAVLPDGVRVAAEVSLDEELERATLHFTRALPRGAAVLRLEFHGPLRDDLIGFLPLHLHRRGRQRAGHRDEPAGRHRRAPGIPVLRRTALKATFEARGARALAAYSNSPVASETALADGRREVRFSPTMKMSTYLVAFAVGPFESTPAVDVDGVPLAVVYPSGKGHLSGFALEIGAFALRFYADYFGIPYPGDKVDLLAIPDFAYGAMENLGCITFRETASLIDPATASTADVERVAEVVAHELAHMWFGDLVTMEWWRGSG